MFNCLFMFHICNIDSSRMRNTIDFHINRFLCLSPAKIYLSSYLFV